MPGALTGLIPACHTPFDRGGNLELSVVPRQAELFRESGMSAVFVAGTTGEWSSMTSEERMALCDRWTETAGADLKVAVHVGHNSQAEAVALAAHARESGAAAIAAVAPSYFKPASVADLVEFLHPDRRGGRSLAVLLLRDPRDDERPAVDLADSSTRPGSASRTSAGLKFSHYDLVELQECVERRRRGFDVLFGQDEFLLAGLSLGVRGAVGCTYNFAGPPLSAADRGSFAAGRARRGPCPRNSRRPGWSRSWGSTASWRRRRP